MRTYAIAVIAFSLAAAFLGCGLLGDGQIPAKGEAEPQVRKVARVGYDGATSLEERVFWSSVIARVRLSSVSSSVESGPSARGTKHMALLEFSFTVVEYLKGSGPSNFVAVWNSAPPYDTRQQALDAQPAIVAARDTQWDGREAVVFLKESQTYLASTQQAGRYYLSYQVGHSAFPGDDNYSIASRHNKLWLPAESAGSGSSYLLDVPSATDTAPTITLADLKARIATVAAKLDAGDGSEEYRECVWRSYLAERREGHYREMYPSREGSRVVNDPPHMHDFDSGLPAGSVLYEDDQGFGPVAENRMGFWFDGGNEHLLGVRFGDPVPYDSTGDGVNDSINFTRHVESVRPLPTGTYQFHLSILRPFYKRCDGYRTRYEWTVIVTAPEGVLHELFFDPVTVGTTVAADDTNGQLQPTSFNGASGSSAALEAISWEAGAGDSGTVKIEVDPDDALAGHVLDFIELDGTVSLTLDVFDATVDAMTNTLIWAVSSQPWHDGDQLMLRIRKAQ